MPNAPAVPPPVNPNDLGRGPMVVGVTWTFFVLASTACGLWFYARKKNRVPPGWDNWIMLFAVINALAVQIQVTVALKYGVGKHDQDLTIDQLIMISKLNWTALVPGMIVSTFARISITILLIRLFGVHKWFKAFLIIITVVQCVAGFVFILISYLQASPIEALWDFLITDARRWDPRVWLYTAYFVQTLYTFSDLTYVLIPVALIWRLNMPLQNRIGLIILMCVSLITMVMSILKTVYIARAGHAKATTVDVQYEAILQVLFGVLEQDIVIIMGCVPSLRNLFIEGFKPLSALRSSRLASLIRGNRSANRSKHIAEDDPSYIGYHDLEERSSRKPSRSGGRTDPRYGSQDDLVEDLYHIKVTDEFDVTHGPNTKGTRPSA
ncbi:hypothetical protein K491DRAFT_636917 [Lophiostoma macrostomum CBS 122681]|uniref:Rhodopsin domain-containing protein n=1 Tax=Lophiostoma macrostomum CBS 122681 TaxID=1314788 RepID=A0A6A6SYT1_9PLEO|nr:hypothetical protein K491DRAFT_636917 [Lophiostoma macrostomum CBS 122681]